MGSLIEFSELSKASELHEATENEGIVSKSNGVRNEEEKESGEVSYTKPFITWELCPKVSRTDEFLQAIRKRSELRKTAQ